jgi:hypothetical protein
MRFPWSVLPLNTVQLSKPAVRAPNNLDRVLEIRLARHTDGSLRDSVDGDIPEAGAGHHDLCRELVERPAVIAVASAILETAKAGVVHEPNVAGVGAFYDDKIALVKVLALVNVLHGFLVLTLTGKNITVTGAYLADSPATR